MLTLLRRKDTLPRNIITLPEEMCNFSHHFHDKLRIATILCSGHGMMRTRGQLFASSRTGSKIFCMDGTLFGWKLFWMSQYMIRANLVSGLDQTATNLIFVFVCLFIYLFFIYFFICLSVIRHVKVVKMTYEIHIYRIYNT